MHAIGIYPYIEFEDHCSQRRKEWRWLWKTTWVAIYGSALWDIVSNFNIIQA